MYKVYNKNNEQVCKPFKTFAEAKKIADGIEYSYIKCDGEKVYQNGDITENVIMR